MTVRVCFAGYGKIFSVPRLSNQTRIYFDNAATTPLSPAAREAMEPYWSEVFGNASSPYAVAREARMALDTARREVARLIGAHDDEVVWTAGGTESDNWALLGVALGAFEEKGHAIVSAIEHHAVLEAGHTLRELGFEVDEARPNGDGVVEPEEIQRLLRPDTRLISVMTANNETGVLQPVAEIAALAREAGVPFHTDATQSAGKLPLDVDFLNGAGVDLLTLSAHKFGGPKGAGALYIRRGTKMKSLLRGGAQERGRRAGTENVPAIAGFGAAAHAARHHLSSNTAHLRNLREKLEAGLARFPEIIVAGGNAARAPHITNMVIPGKRAESLALALDLRGFAVGTGSACASGAVEPSHVLRAMGYAPEQAKAASRVSFGLQNTSEEVEEFLEVLEKLVSHKER